jgi:cytoskeletal protein RodZ
VPQGIGATALDAGRATAQRAAEASRRPRVRLAAGLVAIVVGACVVVAVLLATMSSSSKNASNNVQPARPAAPPARTAPAPSPSTLTLVSRDDQGAWFNVNTSRLTVSAAATGRVWLQVVAGNNAFGPVLFQGILTDGQTQTITNDAPVWMRIGASSNVNVKVNGAGVLLPQTPNTFNLAFTHS